MYIYIHTYHQITKFAILIDRTKINNIFVYLY